MKTNNADQTEPDRQVQPMTWHSVLNYLALIGGGFLAGHFDLSNGDAAAIAGAITALVSVGIRAIQKKRGIKIRKVKPL